MQNVKKKKTTTMLTVSFTLLLMTCMITIQYDKLAHASHGTLNTFQTGNIQYMCNDNLSKLDYERIDPCKEFGKSTTTWSTAISNLNITNASSNAEITVFSGKIMKEDATAEMMQYPSKDSVQHATIKFSLKIKWGDGTYWLHVLSRHDFQTVALHEMGHALGLDHDSNSSLMKERYSIWEVQRTIPSHDKSAVQEKFGNE